MSGWIEPASPPYDSMMSGDSTTSTIYLDNNATTPVAPEVVDAMAEVLRDVYGNPSSLHRLGQLANFRVEQARQQVAALLGASPREIVFTSCGTEATNLAVRGTLNRTNTPQRIVTTTVEHEATLRVCEELEADGVEVVRTGVDREGRLDLDALRAALETPTGLVTLMWANNETGVLFPVEDVVRIAAESKVPAHIDAVQVAGKLPMNVGELGAQLVSISAHKFHGPKGAGALYVRRGTRLRPQLVGGHQERDLRAGTQNVAAIVGMGVAAELAAKHVAQFAMKVEPLRDRLEAGLLERVPNAGVNGDRANRTPNTTNVSFRSLEAESILLLLSENGICCSAGAACQSGTLEASHVLQAMGVEPKLAHGAVRFSLSRLTTAEEIDAALQRIPPLIARLAAMNRVVGETVNP